MRKMFRGFPCKGEKRLVQRKPRFPHRYFKPDLDSRVKLQHLCLLSRGSEHGIIPLL